MSEFTCVGRIFLSVIMGHESKIESCWRCKRRICSAVTKAHVDLGMERKTKRGAVLFSD